MLLGSSCFTLINTVFAENVTITIVRGAAEGSLISDPQSESQTSQVFESYHPSSSVEIMPNTTVIWYNNDTFAHTVKSGSPDTDPGVQFDSGIIREGKKWNHTFTETGEYEYFDSDYPMEGKVIVRNNINLTNPLTTNSSIQENDNLSDIGRIIKGH